MLKKGKYCLLKCYAVLQPRRRERGYSSCHLSLPKNFNLTSLYRNERKLKEGLTVRISTQGTSVTKRRSL